MTQNEKIVLDPPLVVVIDVRMWNGYWRSFGAKDPSSLLCIDGTRCCLGFAMARQGWRDEDLADLSYPTDLPMEADLFWCQRVEHDDMCQLGEHDRTLETNLAAWNDMTDVDPRVKADKIRSVGREHGIRFRFTHWDEADAMTTPPRKEERSER